MSNWEYKVITSGRGGFASPALLEKFLNDLGQEQWEILNFHTAPDNPLAFTGLARRPTERDWSLEDAAKAAARAEADKLRAEFEAKFRAGTLGGAAATAEEQGETFLAGEKSKQDGDLRRLRDTSRDDDADAPEEDGAPRDEWDKLASEDELPAFFDAIRPHMRRNQRGPGMSVGVDYLAKKWRLDESDLKTALVECGLQIPADENAKPVHVEYEGELFWVNINRRGEIWINLREKPQPVFRIVQGKRVENEATPPDAGNVGGGPSPDGAGHQAAPVSEKPDSGEHSEPEAPSAPKTLLDKMRGLMRRNRRGHGWSGSFPFLTKALKTDEAGLLAQLGEHGLVLPPEGSREPAFKTEGAFTYWLEKNQRGEIWINARKGQPHSAAAPAAGDETGSSTSGSPGHHAPSAGPAPVAAPAGAEPPELPPPGNTLAAVRLLLQPKKRGDGFAALVGEVAAQLGRTEDVLLAALTAANLNVPEDSKAKPTFGEHGGEIFWLNRNARGELWLNAKASKSGGARRSRRGPAQSGAGDESGEEAGAAD
jgi:hypothetical protein